LRRLLADDSLQQAALHAIRQLRFQSLTPNVLEIARDPTGSTAGRSTAIAVIARLQPPGGVEALRSLLKDQNPTIASAALNGLIGMQDATSLRQFLTDDSRAIERRRAACERLMDDTPGAILLIRLLEDNRLCEELRRMVVAKATSHPDANVRVLYEKFIPEDQRQQKLGSAVSAEEILKLSGDANRGRNIFFKSSAAQCNRCHAIQGFGSDLGPELSNIGKKYDRGALLETILLPSKAISHEYRPYLLETTGGQVYAGFLIEKTEKQIVLRDVNRQQVRVPAEEVERLVEQEKSLMPELVLSEITSQDAADLLAFLETCK
jgi:putative heme-binding domain-containing protein